jgi:hypothetical protein
MMLLPIVTSVVAANTDDRSIRSYHGSPTTTKASMTKPQCNATTMATKRVKTILFVSGSRETIAAKSGVPKSSFRAAHRPQISRCPQIGKHL